VGAGGAEIFLFSTACRQAPKTHTALLNGGGVGAGGAEIFLFSTACRQAPKTHTALLNTRNKTVWGIDRQQFGYASQKSFTIWCLINGS